MASGNNKYKDKCPICLWRSTNLLKYLGPENGGKEQYFPIIEGSIGSSKEKCQIEIEGLEQVHCKIYYDVKSHE